MRLMDGLPLYVSGRLNTDAAYYHTWDLQGIFDTEEAAKASCRDKTYFYFTMKLNESLPHETVVRADSIFPKFGAHKT